MIFGAPAVQIDAYVYVPYNMIVFLVVYMSCVPRVRPCHLHVNKYTTIYPSCVTLEIVITQSSVAFVRSDREAVHLTCMWVMHAQYRPLLNSMNHTIGIHTVASYESTSHPP